MCRRIHTGAHFALILMVVLLSVSVVSAQDQPKPDGVGMRPDAPPYALHGPYWVGTQTLEMDAGTDKALRFTVWYPALNPGGLEESVTYLMSEDEILTVQSYGVSPDESFDVLGHALADAAPDLSVAPYPLVIFSHSFTAPMWYMYIGEHLASYGFVVIAPEHVNDSWDNPYTGAVIRLFDVKRTINDAEILTAGDGVLAGMIDIERIAVGGHTYGGMISYGAGGAPINWSSVEQFCNEYPDTTDCTNLEGQHQEILDLLQANEVTAEPPVVWDSRVDALFPMSGTIELQGQQGLASITIPMMTLFGSAEQYAFLMTPAYEYVASPQKAQVIFQEAGFGIFNNQCEAFPYIQENGLYWACSDPVWDLARAHDLTNHFVTAFLLDTLKGDADAHAALAPDAVSFPGITYEAQGF